MSCPICGSNSSKQLKLIRVENKKYSIVKCNSCGMIYRLPLKVVRGIYGEEYMSKRIKPTKSYIERRKKWFSYYLRKIKNLEGGLLLDIGCGEGYLMELAKLKGYKCIGTELDSKVVKNLRNKNLNVLKGDVLKLNFNLNSFDVIVMSHLIEHLPNPKEYLRRIYNLLKPQGLLLIMTPNENSLLSKLANLSFIRKYTLLNEPFQKFEFMADKIIITPKILDKTGIKMFKIDALHHILFFTPKTLFSIMKQEKFKLVKYPTGNVQYVKGDKGVIHFLKTLIQNNIVNMIARIFNLQQEIFMVFKKN